MELVHLVFLLQHNFIMPIYTGFVYDPKFRYEMGWVSVSLLVVQLLLVTVIIVLGAIITIKSQICRKLHQKNLKNKI